MPTRSLKFHSCFACTTSTGIVSRNDLEIILRQLVGSTLSEEKIDALVQKAMNEVLELENNTSNSDSNNRKNNSSSSNNNNNATALPGLTRVLSIRSSRAVTPN